MAQSSAHFAAPCPRAGSSVFAKGAAAGHSHLLRTRRVGAPSLRRRSSGTPAPALLADPTLPPHDYLKPSAGGRAWALARFVLSALGAAIAIHFALQEPWAGVLLVSVAVAFGLPQLRARQRLRQLLSSGNLTAIL